MKNHVPVEVGHIDPPGRCELGSAVEAAIEAQHVQGFAERVGEAGYFSWLWNHGLNFDIQIDQESIDLDER
jgi:hypothetical protein